MGTQGHQKRPQKPSRDEQLIIKGFKGMPKNALKRKLDKITWSTLKRSDYVKKRERRYARIIITNALDAAGLDPREPAEKNLRIRIHKMMQARADGDAELMRQPPKEDSEFRKKAAGSLLPIYESMAIIQKAKGQAAAQRFINAWAKHTVAITELTKD